MNFMGYYNQPLSHNDGRVLTDQAKYLSGGIYILGISMGGLPATAHGWLR
jgi:hypothetical protein